MQNLTAKHTYIHFSILGIKHGFSSFNFQFIYDEYVDTYNCSITELNGCLIFFQDWCGLGLLVLVLVSELSSCSFQEMHYLHWRYHWMLQLTSLLTGIKIKWILVLGHVFTVITQTTMSYKCKIFSVVVFF